MEYIQRLTAGMHDFEVDGDGEIGILIKQFDNNYANQEDQLYVTIEELEEVLERALAHRDAYQAYKANGFEEVE